MWGDGQHFCKGALSCEKGVARQNANEVTPFIVLRGKCCKFNTLVTNVLVGNIYHIYANIDSWPKLFK